MKTKPVVLGVASCAAILTLAAFWYYLSAGKRVTMVTDKYIFSAVNDPQFHGEGFVVTFQNGREIFAYSSPEEDPHAIENVRRKLFSAARTKVPVSYPVRLFPRVSLYLASKYDLGAEHQLLPARAYDALAEKTRQRGLHKKLALLSHQLFNVASSGTRFSCRRITGIDGLTRTTGGSVYLITVHFAEGDPLNIGLATTTPGGTQLLTSLSMEIKRFAGTDAWLVAEDPQLQHEIFTTAGVRSGWVANVTNVSLESEGRTVRVVDMIPSSAAEENSEEFMAGHQGSQRL